MRKDVLNIEAEHTADESAAEFLRAREAKVPGSLEELRQASESASAAVEQVFGNLDRLRAMKESEPEEEREDLGSSSYVAWIHAALDLDEAFLDEGHGALGRQLIELVSLDNAAFVGRKDEARRLLQHTSNVALRVYPSIHRLVTLGFGASRFEVAERLSVGDLIQQERVHSVSVTPRRKTIIGLLRDLDARLPENERTNTWSLEVSPELPPVLVVSDPFQSENKTLTEYWVKHVGVARKERDVRAGMLSLSGERTSTIISDLEDIAEHAPDDVLQNAARSVATWLVGKQIYYTNPNPPDFELYHLGMEDPTTLMEIVRSLDVIKHFDPEFFFELIGIDPQLGGRSPSFGSFLHKAIYNTQRAVDHAAPELGEMAIRTMMNQLLTLDDQVQTYSAVVSQESLKAMAGEITRSVGEANTTTSKAQTLMMMAIPYSHLAVDAEVRRQLDAMREASSENIIEELRRRIEDIEHPLKLADYLAKLPRSAVDDYGVRRELRKVLSEEQIESGVFRSAIAFVDLDDGVERYTFNIFSIAPALYKRIPLIDETREDLGFAMRIRIATRDAVNIKSGVETAARDFLKAVMPIDLFRVDFEAIEGGMGYWERRAVKKLGFGESVWSSRRGDGDGIHERRDQSKASQEDKAFFAGQIMVDALGSGIKPQDGFVEDYFTVCRNVRPDLIFLSVIAHPKGKEIAFKYFDKFCDMIPAERMCDLIKGSSIPCSKFRTMFERIGPESARTYLAYLREKVFRPSFQLETLGVASFVQADTLVYFQKINKVYLNFGTPWEIQTGYRPNLAEDIKLDLFDVYQSVKQACLKAGLDLESVERSLRNPEVDPPTEEQLKEMRACYEGPQTSYGSDALDATLLVARIRTYLLRDWIKLPNGEEIFAETVKKKIIRY